MEYWGAGGTLIHEKNLKSKLSCQTPFNLDIMYTDKLNDSPFLRCLKEGKTLGKGSENVIRKVI
jgi:hypothetical protein